MSNFYIENIDTGYVLDVAESDRSAGAPIIMYKYYGTCNQHWYYKDKMLYSQLNCMVLDVSPEGHLVNYPAHGGPNQRWYFEGDFIRSGNGQYLDVESQNRCHSAKLITYELNRGWNQMFRVIPV